MRWAALGDLVVPMSSGEDLVTTPLSPPTAVEAAVDNAVGVTRLHPDVELRDYLAAQNFEGRDYDEFERVIASYGIGAITGMIKSRQIIEEISKKGLLGARELSNDSLRYWPRDHEVAELTIDTVTAAVDSCWCAL